LFKQSLPTITHLSQNNTINFCGLTNYQ